MSQPEFLSTSFKIAACVQRLSPEDFQHLLTLKPEAAPEYYALWQDFPLDLELHAHQASPAATAFQGIAYQYLHADTWTCEDWRYARDHMRSLSALYGLLSPLDAVCPYRLEMKHKIPVASHNNLYELWSDSLGIRLSELAGDAPVLNLMSKEYEKASLPYMSPDVSLIHFDFRIKNKDGLYKTQATWAKISRGAMVSYVIKQRINTLEDIKEFNHAGFYFDEGLSGANNFVFLADKPSTDV